MIKGIKPICPFCNKLKPSFEFKEKKYYPVIIFYESTR